MPQGRSARRSEHAVNAIAHRVDELGRDDSRERADDEAIGPDARRRLHGARVLARVAAEQDRDGVRLVEDELVVLLQHDDAIVGATCASERTEEGRRAGADRARHEDVRARGHALREQAGDRARNRPAAHEIFEAEVGAMRLADDDHVTLVGRHRAHGEEARASREAALDEALAIAERLLE